MLFIDSFKNTGKYIEEKNYPQYCLEITTINILMYFLPTFY